MAAMLEHLKQLLEEAVGGLARVSTKNAFGSHGFYVDDKMFALAFRGESRIGVKLLEPALYEELGRIEGAVPWAPHRSTMSHWLLVPEAFHDDVDALKHWVRRAYASVDAAPDTRAAKKKSVAKKAPAKKAAAKKAARRK